MNLPHRLDRTIDIEAPRDVVFRFFTDSARWAGWWGAGSAIDARPGGRMLIRYPNAVEAAGEVLEIDAPERIVFTYGYASGTPIAVGGSDVTITLDPIARGTRLTLTHDFADAALRDHHVQGWRYQLSVFANAVADDLHQNAATLVDTWFAAWCDADETARTRTLSTIAVPGITLRDRFSSVSGVEELTQHIAGSQRFMPGVRLERAGNVRHCLGTVLADWTAAGPNGEPRGKGTNVFSLGPDGRIESVIGFWG